MQLNSRTSRSVVVNAIVAVCALSVSAQEADERYLVPLYDEYVAREGAFGSEWRTELTMFAAGDENVRVSGSRAPCNLIPCPPSEFQPYKVFSPELLSAPDLSGAYFYRLDEGSSVLFHNLRVYDVSRSLDDWGTQIPIVAESEAAEAGEAIHLLNVPGGERFRINLRVYSFDNRAGTRRFRVAVHSMEVAGQQSELLTSTISYPDMPGFSLVGNLQDFIEGDGPFRIEIEALDGSQKFWAFASITHNETQHVTIVAP